MPSIEYPRALRLILFALLALVLAYLLVQSALAWGYAYSLTHPSCRDIPQPIAGLPQPQEVTLETRDGLALAAWYYQSANGVALLAMGGSCGSLGGALPPVDFLVEAGYGVLQIDSRASAEPRSAVTLGGNEIMDVEAGLAFLEDRPEVGAIGAIGFSMGGVSAIRAAARYPQIEALVAEGGFYNLGADFVEPQSPKSPVRGLFLHSIALAFWANSRVNPWSISPIDDLPAISPRPLLLIYGQHEAESGHAQAQFDAAQQPKELWIVAGGDHGRNHTVAPAEYRERVLAFFSEHLLSTHNK